MVFRSGGQDDEDEREDTATGQGSTPRTRPPADDPAAAELVYYWAPRGDERVFDLLGWPPEALQLTRSMLEASAVTHTWEGDKVVVIADDREETQTLLDEVVAAHAPAELTADADKVAYDLAGWPDHELERLTEALSGRGIEFSWTDADELLVYDADEEAVDALFDELELHGPEEGKIELEGDGLTALLTALFICTDRLKDNPNDGDAVIGFAGAAEDVAAVATPIGFDTSDWALLVSRCGELRTTLADPDVDADDDDVSARSRQIRDQLQAWL